MEQIQLIVEQVPYIALIYLCLGPYIALISSPYLHGANPAHRRAGAPLSRPYLSLSRPLYSPYLAPI